MSSTWASELDELPATVPQMLAAADRDREMVAAGGRRLTYGEADDRSAELAAGLLDAGVGKASRVAILHPNGIDWVLAWLATTRIGALSVPLSTFSPGPELATTIRYTDAQVLLMGPSFAGHDLCDRVADGLGVHDVTNPSVRLDDTPYLRSIHVTGPAVPAWATAPPEASDTTLVVAAEQRVTPADLLLIVSTSGATAAPKAVVHTHGSYIRHAALLARRYGIEPTDRLYSPMPLFWVGGLTMVLLFALTTGACAVLQEHFEPGETLDLIESERVTRVSAWPTATRAMVEHPTFAGRDLSSVRSGTLADALTAGEQATTGMSTTSSALGMTETGGPHTLVRDDEPLPERLQGSFGQALPGFEHLVLDPDGLPTGGEGELAVRGPFVMDGFYKRERFETFTPDGWYRTSDLGWFDDEGHLHFTGRRSAMIKTNGANVAPSEVEAVLASHPAVSGALVVGLPHPERGQDVAAAVVVAPGTELSTEDLLDHARRSLSSFKVPRHLVFLAPEEVPVLPTGKVDMVTLTTRIASKVA